MRRYATLLAIAVLTFTAVSPALGAGPTLKREFQALYDRQAQLTWKRDAKGLMEFNAPDHYVKTLAGDSIPRQKLEEGMNGFFTSG